MNLASRKLAGAIAAMVGIVAVVLGLAALYPQLFTEQPLIVLTTIGSIAGLGGWQIAKQAAVDVATVTTNGNGQVHQ